jgi:hypothetical protein
MYLDNAVENTGSWLSSSLQNLLLKTLPSSMLRAAKAQARPWTGIDDRLSYTCGAANSPAQYCMSHNELAWRELLANLDRPCAADSNDLAW